MSKRAHRRHKRAVKLARRYRILNAYGLSPSQPDPRAMHFHLNCNCWEKMEGDRHRRARREARQELRSHA